MEEDAAHFCNGAHVSDFDHMWKWLEYQVAAMTSIH